MVSEASIKEHSGILVRSGQTGANERTGDRRLLWQNERQRFPSLYIAFQSEELPVTQRSCPRSQATVGRDGLSKEGYVGAAGKLSLYRPKWCPKRRQILPEPGQG